jgi:hypothetical protein
MSFLCLGLSLADLASWAGPVASGESRGPLDLVPWPATSLCARGGKEMFRAHADRLSYQTRSTVINRKDYGITLNAALETGAVLVSDKHP